MDLARVNNIKVNIYNREMEGKIILKKENGLHKVRKKKFTVYRDIYNIKRDIIEWDIMQSNNKDPKKKKSTGEINKHS